MVDDSVVQCINVLWGGKYPSLILIKYEFRKSNPDKALQRTLYAGLLGSKNERSELDFRLCATMTLF